MHNYTTRRVFEHRPEDLFALVADIEAYPEFLPYCTGAKIISREWEGDCECVDAELRVQYHGVGAGFTSRARLERAAGIISVEYRSGPLQYLANEWRFGEVPGENRRTELHFAIEFKFRSFIIQRLAISGFDPAMRKIMQAFEARADELFAKGG